MSVEFGALEVELSRLSKPHRVAFCASCAQRLLPNYEKFSLHEEWGEPRVLRRALDEVWDFLLGQPLNPQRTKALANQCEENAPDTEHFESLHTSSALDAAATVVEAVRCVEDGNPERAVRAARSARDAVDMYIQMRDHLETVGQELEAAIARDPLMQRELTKQQEDLTNLKARSALTADFISALRTSSSYDILV